MLHPEVGRLWEEYLIKARPYWEKYQAKLSKLSSRLSGQSRNRKLIIGYHQEFYRALCAELEPLMDTWMEGVKRLQEQERDDNCTG